MLIKFYVQKVLSSEGTVFKRSYIQKVICSEGHMFRRSYTQKILYSVDSMCKRSHVPRVLVQKGLCSEGSISRRSYVQKVICSECPMFRRFHVQYSSYVQKALCSVASMFNSARRSLGHREISGTRHGTKTQCKRGRGTNQSAWHSAIYNTIRSTINYNLIGEVWSEIIVKKTQRVPHIYAWRRNFWTLEHRFVRISKFWELRKLRNLKFWERRIFETHSRVSQEKVNNKVMNKKEAWNELR